MRVAIVIFITALAAFGVSWAMWRSMLVPPTLTKVPTPPTARQRQFGAALTPQGEVNVERKLPADFKPPGGLDETVRAMAKRVGVYLLVNRRAIREAGGNPDAAVTANVAGLSLGDALLAVMAEQKPPLACVADQVDALTVTTPLAARSSMMTTTYDVRDLAPTIAEERLLLAKVRADVAPAEWDLSATHPGATVRSAGTGKVSIRISAATHHDVAVYLNRVRYRRAAEAFAWRTAPVMAASTGVVSLILLLRRMVRARQRSLQGRCRRCGYDLRASAGRCPECGEEITFTGGTGIRACAINQINFDRPRNDASGSTWKVQLPFQSR